MSTPVPHKHKALTDIYYAAPEWWDVYVREFSYMTWLKHDVVSWSPLFQYKLEKSAKHPDNLPKKRLIDWSKMPRGTMTNGGAFLSVHGRYADILQSNNYSVRILLSDLRLKEQTEFTSWDGQGKPVPEGVVAEYKYVDVCANCEPFVFFSKSLVPKNTAIGVGYRIIGLAEGWTDDPSEAV